MTRPTWLLRSCADRYSKQMGGSALNRTGNWMPVECPSQSAGSILCIDLSSACFYTWTFFSALYALNPFSALTRGVVNSSYLPMSVCSITAVYLQQWCAIPTEVNSNSIPKCSEVCFEVQGSAYFAALGLHCRRTWVKTYFPTNRPKIFWKSYLIHE